MFLTNKLLTFTASVFNLDVFFSGTAKTSTALILDWLLATSGFGGPFLRPHRNAKHKIRPIAVDVVWSVCLSVCLSKCLLSVGHNRENHK